MFVLNVFRTSGSSAHLLPSFAAVGSASVEDLGYKSLSSHAVRQVR
jgi:hypothetical protein